MSMVNTTINASNATVEVLATTQQEPVNLTTAGFALVGLLAVAYLVVRQKE